MPVFHPPSCWRNSKPGLSDKKGIKIRSLFRNFAVFYWHKLVCVGSLLASSYKQLRSRNHRHSQRTCGACPRGVSAYYTFCESHGWGTLCKRISHPTFSLHIPQPRLGEIRQWKDVCWNGCISTDLPRGINDTRSVACTWVYGGGVDVWFWKQHDRDHRHSLHSAPRVFPQGATACYTFCGSNVGTACSKASHPPCDLRATPLCLHTERSVSKVKLGFKT